MSEKISINAGESTLELIEQVKDFNQVNGMKTRAINMVSDHYLALLEYATPELAECEWMSIIVSYTGHAFTQDIARECRSLPWQVQDAIEHEGVGKNYGVEEVNFIPKLRAYGFGEKMCIIHVVRRWWTMADENFDSDRARLQAAGAKVREESE